MLCTALRSRQLARRNAPAKHSIVHRLDVVHREPNRTLGRISLRG